VNWRTGQGAGRHARQTAACRDAPGCRLPRPGSRGESLQHDHAERLIGRQGYHDVRGRVPAREFVIVDRAYELHLFSKAAAIRQPRMVAASGPLPITTRFASPNSAAPRQLARRLVPTSRPTESTTGEAFSLTSADRSRTRRSARDDNRSHSAHALGHHVRLGPREGNHARSRPQHSPPDNAVGT